MTKSICSEKHQGGGFFAEVFNDDDGKLEGFAYAATREEAEEKAGKMAARVAALEAVAVAAKKAQAELHIAFNPSAEESPRSTSGARSGRTRRRSPA